MASEVRGVLVKTKLIKDILHGGFGVTTWWVQQIYMDVKCIPNE